MTDRAAGVGIATEKVIIGREQGRDLTLDADTVIIGSGAGGCVVAAQLAEAGERVIVLEEGPFVSARTYGKMRPSQSMRSVWRDNAMSFALPIGDTPLINVTMGRAVGGSSIVTGGVCFRTPDEVLDTWADEMGLVDLTPERMAPWFDEVEQDIHVETVPEHMRSRATELFGEGLKKRGIDLKPLRRNTHECRGSGTCNFGCPRQSKLSVDLNYLPRAMMHQTRVVSDCLVQHIQMKGSRAVGVTGRLLDHRGKRRHTVEVRARRVVVSAGGWHSPLLLRDLGVGRRSRQLGRNLTLHPSFRMLARFDETVNGWSGSLQSAFSDAFMKQGITLISLFIPTGVLAATMPGFGPHHAEHVRKIPNFAVFGGLVHDDGGGVVRRGPGREPLVTYKMARRDRAVIPEAIKLMADVFFDAGARQCYLPIMGHEPVTADELRRVDFSRFYGPQIESASQHPLGSCRMGTERSRSVVDPDGRVWDTDNLYVADGSVVPTSLGVNPQVTVMAMALRIGRRLVERGYAD